MITGADGVYSFNVTPKILTTYRAVWKTASSLPVQTAVAPSISFGRMNGFVTRVYAGRSMARKQVQLQRFSSFGQWVTIKRVSLDLNSRARFEAVLPAGPNRLRIAMSVNQAGAGYLAAFSREIVYRKAGLARVEPARHVAFSARRGPGRARREPSAAEERTERPRSRTEQAVGCTTGPILKTGWATGPVPLRR